MGQMIRQGGTNSSYGMPSTSGMPMSQPMMNPLTMLSNPTSLLQQLTPVFPGMSGQGWASSPIGSAKGGLK